MRRTSRTKAPKPWVPAPGRPPRLLIVRLSALGDVLHALPVLSALRSIHPAARIDWVAEDRVADVLRGRDDLGRVVVLPRRALRAARGRPFRWLAAARGFLRDLRAVPYDAALDLQGNLKSGLVLRASRARVRFGLDRTVAREGNHLLTTRRALPPASARHRVERNLALLAQFLGRPVPYLPPDLPRDAAADAGAARALAEMPSGGRRLVLLHPGTSGFGAFKRWPAERFGDLAGRLAADGASVGILAGPGEEDLAAKVARASDGAATVLPSPDLAFLVALVRRAALFVAADTGPLHLASLLGVPVLGLFGPKDPAVYGPYGVRPDGSAGLLPVVARADVACRPCGLRRCADPVCMRGLEPAEVHRRARAALASPGG